MIDLLHDAILHGMWLAAWCVPLFFMCCCPASPSCPYCSPSSPSQFQVEFSGVSDVSGCDCTYYNSTFICDWYGTIGNPLFPTCVWYVEDTGSGCAMPYVAVWVSGGAVTALITDDPTVDQALTEHMIWGNSDTDCHYSGYVLTESPFGDENSTECGRSSSTATVTTL